MAAIFYRPDPNVKIFKCGFPTVTAVRIPIFDGLAAGPTHHSIITTMSVENSETIQYFLTFDDVISYFYFGKGIGNITLRGLLFSNNEGRIPGITHMYDVIGNNRGKSVYISFGSVTFTCVINNFSAALDSENLVAEYSITLSVINHTLRPKRSFAAC